MPAKTSDHLRYRCRRCGTCCRWPGYVRLAAEDVEPIADFLALPVAEFVERYTVLTHDRRGLSLIENDEGYCVFLTRSGDCMIQPVKPEQCKLFPNFWNFPGFRDACQATDTWERNEEDIEHARTD